MDVVPVQGYADARRADSRLPPAAMTPPLQPVDDLQGKETEWMRI
jgi:hypothetical protein